MIVFSVKTIFLIIIQQNTQRLGPTLTWYLDNFVGDNSLATL